MNSNTKVDAVVQQGWTAARASDGYWCEAAKTDFAIEIRELFDDANINRAELARRIGKTPAYITKIFRGDVNFTIESMVKLCRALGGRLDLRVRPSAAHANMEVEIVHAAPRQPWAWSYASEQPNNMKLMVNAHNDERFEETVTCG